MRRLLVALILAVVLFLILATPAFAWGPGNMPDAAHGGLLNALSHVKLRPAFEVIQWLLGL